MCQVNTTKADIRITESRKLVTAAPNGTMIPLQVHKTKAHSTRNTEKNIIRFSKRWGIQNNI